MTRLCDGIVPTADEIARAAIDKARGNPPSWHTWPVWNWIDDHPRQWDYVVNFARHEIAKR